MSCYCFGWAVFLPIWPEAGAVFCFCAAGFFWAGFAGAFTAVPAFWAEAFGAAALGWAGFWAGLAA